MIGCGNDGESESRSEPAAETEPTEECSDGLDGLPGADGTKGSVGPTGPKGSIGPQGAQGPSGEPGLDGTDCRVVERLVYDDEGDVRDNKCDIYLVYEDTEVFVLRKKDSCEEDE